MIPLFKTTPLFHQPLPSYGKSLNTLFFKKFRKLNPPFIKGVGGELGGGGEQLCQDPLPNGYTRDKMRICQTNYFFDDAIRFFKSNSD